MQINVKMLQQIHLKDYNKKDSVRMETKVEEKRGKCMPDSYKHSYKTGENFLN